jgi:hypothetical protein
MINKILSDKEERNREGLLKQTMFAALSKA